MIEDGYMSVSHWGMFKAPLPPMLYDIQFSSVPYDMKPGFITYIENEHSTPAFRGIYSE